MYIKYVLSSSRTTTHLPLHIIYNNKYLTMYNACTLWFNFSKSTPFIIISNSNVTSVLPQ